MTSIQLENVSVVLTSTDRGRVREVLALDGVNLRVRSGEAMGVIGPTGCGKTTLLRAVAGLVPLHTGRVLFDAQDQREVSPRDRGLGMVFQDYALYPHWNVWNNLSFYFRLRRRQEEVPEKVREAADILGVDFRFLLDRHPRQLSVGQQQQVAIARCLVRDPSIFLMDEPFAHLDAVQRGHARLQVKRLLQRFRVTTLYVTHDQTEAAALCDRVAFLDQGRLLQVASYPTLIAWPESRKVAEFVGQTGTQFIEGAMLDDHFVCPAFSVPLQPHVLVRTRPGQPLTAAIRPSAVTLLSTEDRRQPTLVAEVEWIEPLPLQRLQRAICRAGSHTLVVELPQDEPLHAGERIRLHVEPQEVLIFDGRTGVNLALRAASQG